MLVCDHQVSWEDCRTLASEFNTFLSELKESLFIKRDKLTVNRNQLSQELLLF